MARITWGLPRLRSDETEEEQRRSTWLELFFDLVFVVAIAELSHYLQHHLSASGFIQFTILAMPVWWCWVAAIFYATRFDTDDISDRLITLVQIAIVAVMAANIAHGLSSSSFGFTLSHIAFLILLILRYLNAGYHIPKARPLTTWYSIGFSISLILWSVSVFIPVPWRFLFWGLGLLIDTVTALTASKLIARIPPSLPHMTERIGLFTIIVLGESIVAVVDGVSEQQWNFLSVVTAILGLTIAFSFWWLYFDSVDGSPLEAMKMGKMNIGLSWLYAHLPLSLGIVATAVGIEQMILDSAGDPTTYADTWMLCGAVALCLSTLSFIHWITSALGKTRCRRVVSFYRLISVAFVLVIGAASSLLSPVMLLFLVAAACIIQVLFDMWNTCR